MERVTDLIAHIDMWVNKGGNMEYNILDLLEEIKTEAVKVVPGVSLSQDIKPLVFYLAEVVKPLPDIRIKCNNMEFEKEQILISSSFFMQQNGNNTAVADKHSHKIAYPGVPMKEKDTVMVAISGDMDKIIILEKIIKVVK